MTRTPIDTAALKALEKAATPGPWDGQFAPSASFINVGGLEMGPLNWPISYLPLVDGYPEYSKGLVAQSGTRQDQELIAALRNAAPELIKAVEERDELRFALSLTTPTINQSRRQQDLLRRIAEHDWLDDPTELRRALDRYVEEAQEITKSIKMRAENEALAYASALASLRALLAEAGEATWPFAEDASRMDARGVIMPHACASVGDYQRIARLHAAIQSALRNAP